VYIAVMTANTCY